MVALLEVGRRIGLARRRTGGKPDGVGAMEGTAFALLGLMIAFTFTSAAQRFDDRRQLIVHELNALGTAWLRLDLLPAASQPATRDRFRSYLDHRIAAYRAVPDVEAARLHLDSADRAQAELWSLAVAGAQQAASPQVLPLVLGPLNESFDVASERLAALRMHPPASVWVVLAVLASLCCLLAGFEMSADTKRSWLHIVGMAVLLTVTLYVMVDFELPRVGLVTLENFDQLLVNLRAQLR